jgi:hypothetical protein
LFIFQCFTMIPSPTRHGDEGFLFCPAARFAVCNGPKMSGRDCFEELRPILEVGFSAL